MDAPYFPFYPADWLSDGNVRIMTLEESGAYITLLAFMWQEGKDCTLPDDDRYLSKLLNLSSRKWSSIRKTLIDGPGAVFSSSDGKLTNNRLTKEWQKALGKIKQNADAANARWGKNKSKGKVGIADAMHTHSERITKDDASDMHMRNDANRDTESDPDTESDTEKNKDLLLLEREGHADSVSRALEPPDEGLASVARAYESEGFGPITSTVQEQIIFLKDEFGADWVLMAMKEAVLNNKRRIAYVAAILQNWRADGGPRTSETKREAQAKGPLRAGNSIGSNGSNANSQQDPRYSKFYELFPD